MPNRYEREIEEILRNLETTPNAKKEPGPRFEAPARRKPDYRMPTRRRNLPSFHFGTIEWLLVVAIVAALFGGGYAYANHGQNVVTGIASLIGIVCLIAIVLAQFVVRSPRKRFSPSSRTGNVTPLRRNPFRSIAAQWHIFMLKMRYRRKKDL